MASDSGASTTRRALGSPILVSCIVLAIYLAALGHLYRHGHTVGDFVIVGHFFFENRGTYGQRSPAIENGPLRPSHPNGYDGQFYYFIALDPARAAAYMDVPAYRYQRIAYPIAARALSLGRPRYIPYGLAGVNLIAIVGGVWALGSWLSRRNVNAWPAAVWGLHPGQVFSFELDLADAAGYGVAAVALWLRDHSPLAAGALFGLAGLTRDTTLVFPAVFFLADLWQIRRERTLLPWLMAVLAGALAMLPFACWKVYLQLWLGNGVPINAVYTTIPFGGLLHELPRAHELLPLIVIPMALCGGALLWASWLRRWNVAIALLAINLMAFVVFVNFPIYDVWLSAPRAGLGAVLAAIMLLPVVREHSWFWLASGFWLWVVPLWLLHPVF